MNNLYIVNYGNGSVYKFYFDKILKDKTKVIVETKNGEEFGFILKKVEKQVNAENYNKIIRISNENDVKKYIQNLKDQEKILIFAKKLVKELNLKMKIINVSYVYNRSQLVINFYADERVDFREYAKKMAQKYKTRIELRQIGARDRSREVCGMGPCGQKLCCSRFLKEMDSVSINMAKNQNLALNPTKINGSCNRLMCCLSYEDDIYEENRSQLPKIGEKIKYNGKNEVVKSLNVLEKKAVIYVDRERIELDVEECSKK